MLHHQASSVYDHHYRIYSWVLKSPLVTWIGVNHKRLISHDWIIHDSLEPISFLDQMLFSFLFSTGAQSEHSCSLTIGHHREINWVTSRTKQVIFIFPAVSLLSFPTVWITLFPLPAGERSLFFKHPTSVLSPSEKRGASFHIWIEAGRKPNTALVNSTEAVILKLKTDVFVLTG